MTLQTTNDDKHMLIPYVSSVYIYEPPREKSNNLHMQKQRSS